MESGVETAECEVFMLHFRIIETAECEVFMLQFRIQANLTHIHTRAHTNTHTHIHTHVLLYPNLQMPYM
jgi:hypothetical protein